MRVAAAMAVLLPSAVAAQPLAQVGPQVISLDEFRGVLALIRASKDASAGAQTVTPAGREKILNVMVDRTLYALAARDEGIDKRPDVQAEIQQAITEIIATKYLREHMAKITQSEPELRSYYAAHPEQFTALGRIKARHILVKTREEADAILGSLQHGGDFEALAREKSIDAATRQSDGDLGWVTPGVMVKPFDEALFRLKTGETSGIVQTGFGFHIIHADAVEQPKLPPFEAVKDKVQQRVFEASLAQLKSGLAARYPVTIHRDVLEAMNK